LEWDSKYLTAVNGLQMDVNYTAVIKIYRIDDMWEGIDWRWDIDWEGGYDADGDGYHNQSENPFSLQGGCYHINADLYESGALHSNEDSAVVLASADLDFDVGGTCTDGVFYPVVVDDEGPAENREKGETTSIPGFGVFLAIAAALGAALVARWD
jgi:PGF-CTERM protein